MVFRPNYGRDRAERHKAARVAQRNCEKRTKKQRCAGPNARQPNPRRRTTKVNAERRGTPSHSPYHYGGGGPNGSASNATPRPAPVFHTNRHGARRRSIAENTTANVSGRLVAPSGFRYAPAGAMFKTVHSPIGMPSLVCMIARWWTLTRLRSSALAHASSPAKSAA